MGLRDQTNTTPVVTVVTPPSENLDISAFEDTGREKRGLSDMLSKVSGKFIYLENAWAKICYSHLQMPYPHCHTQQWIPFNRK